MRRALVLVALAVGAAGCRSCLELDGRPYPCVMDSGLPNECAANWRCGLEQSGQPRCHRVGKPGPYVCASDEACEGWHCGVDGVCYDRGDAGAIACRADRADCAPGWRCNPLSQTCQDRDAGLPYACDDDGDCEQRWRCGLDGLCLDAAAEGLGPAAPSLTATRLTPAWTFDGPVTAFSASRTPGTFALLSAGTVHRLDGTYRAIAAPVGTTAVALVGGHTFVATDAGVLRLSSAGAERVSVLADAQLRGSVDGRRVAAWSGSGVFVGAVDDDAGVTGVAPGPVTGADFVVNLNATSGWLWTAAGGSLYVSPSDAGPLAFVPVALPQLRSSCPDAGTDTPLSAQGALKGTALAVEVLPGDGGAPAFHLYGSTAGLNGTACSSQGYFLVQSCAVCPAGSRLHVRGEDPGPTSFTVACVGPGPVRAEHRVQLGAGACTSTPLLSSAGVLSSHDPAAWAFVTTEGAVFQDDRRYTPASPVLGAGVAPELRLYDAERTFLVENGASYAAPPQPLASFCAAVPGAPLAIGAPADRGVFAFPLVSPGAPPDVSAPRGLLDGTSAYGPADAGGLACFEDGQPVFHAALGPTRDGGEVLVVGGEDRVWAIETARLGVDGGGLRGPPARILVRTVPAVAGRFQGLAMVNPALLEGTDYAVGYGLVSSRLFRIRARSSTSWLSEELTLPEGEPISVWADGAHARVGYSDGRVFSAASRVQLAMATPAPVSAYASLCGEGFALAGSTLYRLVPGDGGAVGVWAPVDLGAARLPPLTGARLSTSDRAILVSTAGGVVARVGVPACPP